MAQPATKNQLPADKPYKRHLDDAASHQTDDDREPSTIQKAVEKVSEYVPAAAGPLQQVTGHQANKDDDDDGDDDEKQAPPPPDPSQQPERPTHDGHIEEFVREQHRQDGNKILDGHKQ